MGSRRLELLEMIGDGLMGLLLRADDIPAKTDSQQMAKSILQLREQGRAGEVTEEMMEQADPRTMAAYTPLDMSLDARMDRARAMGFEDRNYFHGSGDPSLTSFFEPEPDSHMGTIYATSNPYTAGTYVDKPEGGIYPVMVKVDDDTPVIDNKGRTHTRINPFAIDEMRGEPLLNRFAPEDIQRDTMFTSDLQVPEDEVSRLPPQMLDTYRKYYAADEGNVNVGYPTTTDHLAMGMDDAGIKALKIENIVDKGTYMPRAHPQKSGINPYPLTDQQKKDIREWERNAMSASSYPATNVQVRDPSLLRSRFARFDPEFAHLRNLSAGAVPVGLIPYIMQYLEDVEREQAN